jgi:hypothetical protein
MPVFRAEDRVDRRHRYPGLLRDGFHGHAGVAMLFQQLARSGRDAGAGFVGLALPRGGLICALFHRLHV